MCIFSQDNLRKESSPDRVDALVWGLTFLFDKMTGRKKGKVESKLQKEYNRQFDFQHNVLSELPTGWMV